MKKILLTASLLIAIFSCKKSQEETANNLLLNIMTAGEWRMEGFTETGINTIAQWSGYTFRYYDTYRVDAKKNGTVVSTGNWGYSLTDTSFSATFPASANDTLKKLNGNWKWVASSPNYVKANLSSGGRYLHLVRVF